MKLYRFFIPVLLCFGTVHAQEKNKTLTISGYIDTYYSYFTHDTDANAFQPYTTVSARNERFGLNVAQIGAHYSSDRIRSNLTLHWGDIAQATWSEEYRAIQEANLGFRIAEDLWIDAGFFTTHIGTESFLPKNNFLSSTAVATYNEPFYQAGAKISYEGFEKLYIELWAVNGYNYFQDVNDAKSFGLLLQYQFNEATSLTYTNLLGRESPDDFPVKQFRTYHNMYLNTRLTDKLFLTLGGDIGTQSNTTGDGAGTAFMYNALATVRYQVNPQWSVTARGERFRDKEGFISGFIPRTDGEETGLDLWGITLGGEYKPVTNAYIRGEARFLRADKDIAMFPDNHNTNERWELMVTLGYHLDHLFNF
ncbi:outer membrane beta-barrel protein [Sinomicrobium weinanense]|uniref:Porin n=1 Tax=Sinomicrobium weinanense TaxID=2842200 RepID=A0A926JW25_9FLAO|nr:outer membrane beta-barrel protein [Sinomicrobium weinanense]MBC9798643.1 porin [Sinomicrobium weinanense]MBU3122362.1 porin [Sinomicrobium weinanense]